MRGRRETRNLQHDVLRSLADGTQGWLSIKGNQGSVFLKEADKPFYTIVGAEEAGAEAPSPCNWGRWRIRCVWTRTSRWAKVRPFARSRAARLGLLMRF